jgi:hypothetical protein
MERKAPIELQCNKCLCNQARSTQLVVDSSNFDTKEKKGSKFVNSFKTNKDFSENNVRNEVSNKFNNIEILKKSPKHVLFIFLHCIYLGL